MIVFHKHHIWPEHAIGPPPKDNLIRVDRAFLQYLRWEDKLAWKTLSGQISNAEATRQAQGKQHSEATKQKMKGPHSLEHKQKLSMGKAPWNKGLRLKWPYGRKQVAQ